MNQGIEKFPAEQLTSNNCFEHPAGANVTTISGGEFILAAVQMVL